MYMLNLTPDFAFIHKDITAFSSVFIVITLSYNSIHSSQMHTFTYISGPQYTSKLKKKGEGGEALYNKQKHLKPQHFTHKFRLRLRSHCIQKPSKMTLD